MNLNCHSCRTSTPRKSNHNSSKARKEASRNKFVGKSVMPDKVKSFREVDSSKNRPRIRPGFVKPMRNGLRKIKNLSKSRPSRAETGLVGERM